jgi:hypothetical protein
MPILLGQICEEFHEEVGALPTAIVISQSGEVHPEAGFFRMAASFGLIADEDAPPAGVIWNGMSDHQRDFWESQVEAVFRHYEA